MKTAADLNIAWAWTDPPPIFLGGFRRDLIRMWRDQVGKDCPTCEKEMTFDRRKCDYNSYASIDHIIPISDGGSSQLKNLRVICRRCNTTRSAKVFDGWKS